MRWWLFIVFTSLFTLVYLLTIGALFFGLGRVEASTLERLGSVFIVETGVAVVALFYSLFSLRSEAGKAAAPSFVDDIAGEWWQYIHDFPGKAVSVVEIRYSQQARQVQLGGETYNERGERSARWQSTAAGINESTGEVFYFWRGDHYSERDHAFSGIGVFQFRPSEVAGVERTATGWYTAGDLQGRLEVTAKINVELCRIDEEDRKVLKSGDVRQCAELIERRRGEWAASFGGAVTGAPDEAAAVD